MSDPTPPSTHGDERGQSGLGKSSLLGAGVVPQLRDRGFGAVVIRLDYGQGAPSLMEQTHLNTGDPFLR